MCHKILIFYFFIFALLQSVWARQLKVAETSMLFKNLAVAESSNLDDYDEHGGQVARAPVLGGAGGLDEGEGEHIHHDDRDKLGSTGWVSSHRAE